MITTQPAPATDLVLEHRLRVAALVVQAGRLLLVKHEHPARGLVWWSPPGGKVEGTESVFACAEREVWEETNLVVTATEIVYVQELIVTELARHNLELFVLGADPSGVLQGLRDGPPYTQEARFFQPTELRDVMVYPDFLRVSFWSDYGTGFPSARYLGLDTM